MKPAKDFLSRFKNFTPPHDAVKKAIADSILAIADVPLEKKNISISHGVAFIETSSIAKNTIRMHRGKILEYIFLNIPQARTVIRDIR